MFYVYLIKVDANPVGVVARATEGYRFYAISHSLGALENLVFDSAEAARSAALVLCGAR
jgi:hypothetical protein